MGFLNGNNNAGGASADQILAAIQNPGVGQGATLDDIIAMGNAPGGSNVLSAIAAPKAASADPTPRQRMSTVDIIGRIADTFAKVGGADPLYQANVDAANERQRQKTDDSWTEKFNVQKLQAGENELQDAKVSRYGQAARGLNAVFQQSGIPGVQKAWPVAAKLLGFNDDEAAYFGQQLADDPEAALMAIDEGLNGAKGSQPKEVTIYKMLQRQDPTGEKAKAYLEQVSKGEMNPYQAAQIDLGRAKMESGERLAGQRIQVQREGIASRERTARIKAKGKDKGATIEPGAAENFRSITGEMRKAYDNLHRSGATVDPNQGAGTNITARLRSSGVGQLVEGALGTSDQTERDKITGARPALMQAIVKATGMSSKQIDSNAEMKMMLQQATDPTMSYPANMTALKRLESMVTNLSKGSGSSSSPRRVLKPRSTGAAPKPGARLKFNPETGKIE